MCVQRFDDSLESAIHTTYRNSLRSSSMQEPRDPLLKVLVSIKKLIQTIVHSIVCMKSPGESNSSKAQEASICQGSNRIVHKVFERS
jgi:hypothetical protein